jgi:Zn-dependent peptidase ImmA (M78 family)/DNA-binding XRE family transcriptional regulator
MAAESRTIVLKDQLIKARGSLGLKSGEVADELGIEEQELISWEEGAAQPSLELLWKLAEIYQRSTDYFLRWVPALPEHLSFRLERRKVMQDLPQEVRKVIVRFDELCRAEAELEEAMQEPRRILIKRLTGDYTPQELAHIERKRMDLGERPIKDLRKLLVNQGIRIFTLPMPDIPANELSGLSWWHDAYGPCILLNGKNNPGRRSFTLAHEYSHLLRSDPPTVCAYMLDIPDERYANQFAVEFLMPATDLQKTFLDFVGSYRVIPTDPDLGKLATQYGVSLEAMGRRLEYLDLIPKGTTDSRIAEWEKTTIHYRGPRGPRWRRQLGEEFVSLAIKAYSNERISLSKLSKYLGQDIRTVLEIAGESKQRET